MSKRPATVRARGLGAELRELRNATGLSTREVAERVGWSASTVNRIENGNRAVTSEDVAALLVIYGVTGQERDRLLELAREASQPGWWETGSPALPTQLSALIRFETEASRIVDVGLVLVPGLLQTPEYARAVMVSSKVPEPEIDPRVATRMGRQVVLTRPEPPEFVAIIDEAALRRPIGGHAVMAEQLQHLLKVADRPHVTLQIVPFSCDGHVSLHGSFVLLEFAKAAAVVHHEHKRSSIFLDEPEDVQPYAEVARILQEEALNSDESADFVAAIAAEYET